MKMSYLAHEVELSKRHEEILSLRTALLQQMEDQLECQMNEKKLQAVEFELANERNTSLLKTRYWTSVEGQLPKWEQFLLGKTNSPVGVTNSRHKKSQKKEPQDKVTIKSSNLPPSAFAFKTPPQSPHSEKQKGTKAYF
ncbi:centrosomal protein 15 isoform X3 [Heterodontus francisci]|uniref:centrosomal protein 15 isoform X3 n=1 Tax=Heterodontus francisci TaxID=7792 RepID=UPI00355B9350